MRKALLVVLILSSALTWAQGGCTGQKPLNGMTTGGYLKGVANASVRVCSDTLTPCTTIPLFSDAALTHSISNPVTTDATGNYQYCAAPGSYNEQISGSGISGTANNTPVTISGDATVYTVDASKQTGVDMCAKIVAAANAAVTAGSKGGVIDAQSFHGAQPCANGLSGWPWTPGAEALWAGKVLLSPDVWIQSDVRFNIPTQVIFDFQTSHGALINSTSRTGGYIGPSNAFTDTVIVEIGGGNPGTGPLSSQGSRLQNAGVTCMKPNGTYIAGTGLLNEFAQELSGWSYVHVSGCPVPWDIENAGTLFGTINGGPYENMHITMDGLSDAQMAGASCGQVGALTSGVRLVGQIRNIHCSAVNNNGTRAVNGITIDGDDVDLNFAKVEGVSNDAVLIGSVHGVHNVHVKNIIPETSVSRTLANAVEISAAHAALATTIEGVQVQDATTVTNILKDTLASGCTIPAATEHWLGFYSRNQDNTVSGASARIISDSSVCPIKLTPATPASTTVQTTDYTATATDFANHAWIPFACATSCTLTLPSSLPSNGGFIYWTNRSNTSNLTINPNGNSLGGNTSSRVVLGTPGSSRTVGGIIFSSGTSYDINGVPQVYTGTTVSIGGGALAAGACASGTATGTGLTGAATTMVATAQTSDGTDPGAGFYLRARVSASATVTVDVCAAVAGTPTAKTYNVRVTP